MTKPPHIGVGASAEGVSCVSSNFLVRCRHCRRIVLVDVSRIGVRESDALVSHLKDCQPELARSREESWRKEIGALLEKFDVAKNP